MSISIEDGVTFDGPENIGHIFDTLFCVQKDTDGRNMTTLYEGKDRTFKFVGKTPFEFNYPNLVAIYGNMGDIEREPIQMLTEDVLAERTGRRFLVTVKGKPQRTAGITGETLEDIIDQVHAIVSIGNISQEQIMADLKDKYQIQTLADLREDEGQFVLSGLQELLMK